MGGGGVDGHLLLAIVVYTTARSRKISTQYSVMTFSHRAAAHIKILI